MRIDQILPNFSYGDAIGNHTLALRDTLRRWGFASEIFCHFAHHKLSRESRFYEEYRRLDAPENVLVYHYSIGSVVTAYFADLKCRKVMIYHNITPAEFFRGVNRRAQWECEKGRRELSVLSGSVALALGDSEYNRRELEELGYGPTGVLPIFVPFEDYRLAPDRSMLKTLGDGRPAVLHVGRFAPNKKIEDLIKTFHFLKRARPDARLVLVGTDVNMENYTAAIKELIARLKLEDVLFTGHVTFTELLACYRAASVYLTMSEHEGFCVPLLEAMLCDVPVAAYAAAAVPGTLGGAGLLFDRKDHPVVAGILDEVLGDGELRRRLVEAGRRRLDHFAKENREAILLAHLHFLGIEPPGTI